MEAGYLLAFASGFSFALSDVLTRIASKSIDRSLLVLTSLAVGTPYLWTVGLIVGENLPPVREMLIFAFIGLIHFGVARYLFYTAITGLGASSASIIVSPVIVVSSILAWIFLGEELAARDALGAVLVATSIILAGRNPSGRPLQGVSRRKGLAAGLLATLIFSITSVLVRYAGSASGSPILGAAISYTTALPIPVIIALRGLRGGVHGGGLRAWGIAVLAGLIVTSAQLFRYTALSMVPVVEALVFISLFPLHTVVLARVLARESGEEVRLVHLVAALLAFTGIVMVVG